VEDIQRQVPVRFMYHPQIVDSFFVTGNFNNTPLQRVLTRIFSETEVYFYISEDKQVIITQGYEVKTDLPFNYFDRTEHSSLSEDTEVVDFLQQEEKKVVLQNALENKIIEIGTQRENL
jgi:hypothetical protein